MSEKSQANHTTGPWVAQKHPLGHYGIFQRDHAHQVAEVFDRNTPEQMVRANAELIAAAPDLLKALQQIGEYTGEGGPNTPWRDIVRECGETARRALGTDNPEPRQT